MADTAPPFPSKIFLSGDAVDIAVYVDADGESPAWEFVKGLPAAGRAKFTSLCEFLAAQGRIANPSSFKHEKNGIFGFKLPNQDRVACFQDGRTWVCTHGLRKNGKWRESDFARAERIRDDISRTQSRSVETQTIDLHFEPKEKPVSEFRLDDLISDEKSFQLLQQERAIVGVAELICQIMERQGVTQKELARRLQKLPSHISQILGGEGNLTLRTIADIFTALGQSLRFDCGSILPVGNADGYPSSLEFEWKADQSRANYWADQTQGSGFSCRRPELAS